MPYRKPSCRGNFLFGGMRAHISVSRVSCSIRRAGDLPLYGIDLMKCRVSQPQDATLRSPLGGKRIDL